MRALSTFSRLLLDLAHLDLQPSVPDYRIRVLERLSEAVPFTSAAWATGALTGGGPAFHTVTLWNQPPQLLADYEAIKHLDPLFAASAQQPGRAVCATARTRLPEAFMPFVERYRLEQAMSTMHTDPRSLLLTGISVWRDDRTAPFTPADAEMMEAAFPHLMELASRRVLAEMIVADRALVRGWWAAADATGRLHSAGAGFVESLVGEFPDWQGPDLPEPLRDAVRTGTAARLSLTARAVRIVPRGELVAVHLRPRHALDELTPRQREIVDLVAQGLTHRDIAARLVLSPATARNHIAHAYERLGVGNRAALVTLLNQLS